MKRIIFCNSTEPHCGVHQYGRNLFDALLPSVKFEMVYTQPGSGEQLALETIKNDAVAVIYNWHPDMGGWIADAPFEDLGCKQILVYHDWQPNTEKFDAVIFSDPTMPDHDNWHSIPRPLPHYPNSVRRVFRRTVPWIGVHGFYGASANLVVERVMKEFDSATIRLHLPFAHFGDQDGSKAKEMAKICHDMVGENKAFTLQINHQWRVRDDLFLWLWDNDLNCYLRDTAADWKGVSSALDAALAVRVPLAVNKCKGFRHVFGCEPSICVEDRTLREILVTGIEPLKPLYEKHSWKNLCARVEAILEGIGVHAD